MIQLLSVSRDSGAIAAESQWTLRRAINFSVRPVERCEQQQASFEALGIACGGNRDIQPGAWAGKRGQGGRHKNARDVVNFYRA